MNTMIKSIYKLLYHLQSYQNICKCMWSLPRQLDSLKTLMVPSFRIGMQKPTICHYLNDYQKTLKQLVQNIMEVMLYCFLILTSSHKVSGFRG